MKKTFIIFIMLIIITLVLMNINTINAVTGNNLESQRFCLKIEKDGQELYLSQEEKVLNKYNTLMLPMDVVFPKVFANYSLNAEQQILTYYDMTLEVKQKENIITVLNVYDAPNGQIDDSVDVEIEEYDEIKYIPIYLLTNISGVEVKIDNKKVYDKNYYYNSIQALDSNKMEHIIEVKIGEVEEKTNSSTTEYVGEEDGALWREEAYKRIEKYRKEDVSIVVKNQNGRELKNATVNIKMTNNEFKFGTAIRMFETTKENKYTGITRTLFNSIGSENGFKWGVLSKNGSAIPKDVIDFAQKNNMHLRGHCLWWDLATADTMDLIGDIDNVQETTMAYIYNQYVNGIITLEEAEELIYELQNNFEDIVLKHIEDEATEFLDVKEWDVINEPISKQYFKYFLYDKKLLTDSSFLTTTNKNILGYDDNEQYYQFLAKCFNKAKEANPQAKLLLNDDKIRGDFSYSMVNDTIRLINNIKKYTNNIDALGVQYHVNNRYQNTPQSYYNQINYVLEQTALKEAVITEYDNYTTSKATNYTEVEKQEKANYLRDTLIAQYSNQNVSGFNFWVYNSGTGSFVEEEWKAYEELMQNWLNDEQSGGTGTTGAYSARVYKGEYTADVSVNNLNATTNFKVDDNTNEIEVLVNSNLEEITVGKKPTKTQYIQNYEELDLAGGTIIASYDDGTAEEIEMTSKDVDITNVNNSILGLQTVTVTYKGEKVTFVVEVVEKSISQIEIKQLPEKTNYVKGESLNLTGGIILVIYNDESTAEIPMTQSNIKVSGYDNTKIGEKLITVEYLENKKVTFKVEVTEKANEELSDEMDIFRIELKNLPQKLKYIQKYETLDLTGGIITVYYANGEIKDIGMTSNGILATGFDNNNIGKQDINITYGKKTITFEIDIIEKSILKIEVISMPSKIQYKQHTSNLDLTGGIILVTYNDETKKQISMQNDDVLISGFDNSILGERAITVSYAGKTSTFAINIIRDTNSDNTTAMVQLPNAGEKIAIALSVCVLVIIATISGKKYIQYLKDTNKQLK